MTTSTKYQEENYIPRGLLFQWHVTERCNLRCAHCYQEAYAGEELGFNDLLGILEQYKNLLKFWRSRARRHRVHGHITVTGGEPFVRDDFLDLLDHFYADRRLYNFAILTNGSFIDKPMAKRLAGLNPAFIQVSIEGPQDTHDGIRGRGNFAKTVEALKRLVKAGIRTLISFTAHQNNYGEFSEVANLGRRLGVSRVWVDRLIPWGTGSTLSEQLLTPEQTRGFFKTMYKVKTKKPQSWFSRTEIAMHRALQFLVAGGEPYHCTAGNSLVTVQPNGDLYPCRRMPVKVGNLMENPLGELYYDSGLFQELRNQERISDGCRECTYSSECRGGLKCLSYAVTGDPFKADPGCWLTSTKHRTADIPMVSNSVSCTDS